MESHSDVEEKTASVQQQRKVLTKPVLVVMRKEKCHSTFLQNSVGKEKVKIKYGEFQNCERFLLVLLER